MMASSHSIFVLLLPAIKPILASTFGSVDKMISGKKFPQNIRALRLIAEIMLEEIITSHPSSTA